MITKYLLVEIKAGNECLLICRWLIGAEVRSNLHKIACTVQIAIHTFIVIQLKLYDLSTGLIVSIKFNRINTGKCFINNRIWLKQIQNTTTNVAANRNRILTKWKNNSRKHTSFRSYLIFFLYYNCFWHFFCLRFQFVYFR